MMIQLPELLGLFRNAVFNGLEKVIAGSATAGGKPTKSEACRLYGRSNAGRWLSEGIITISKMY
jgi:hypothetical protein